MSEQESSLIELLQRAKRKKTKLRRAKKQISTSDSNRNAIPNPILRLSNTGEQGAKDLEKSVAKACASSSLFLCTCRDGDDADPFHRPFVWNVLGIGPNQGAGHGAAKCG